MVKLNWNGIPGYCSVGFIFFLVLSCLLLDVDRGFGKMAHSFLCQIKRDLESPIYKYYFYENILEGWSISLLKRCHNIH